MKRNTGIQFFIIQCPIKRKQTFDDQKSPSDTSLHEPTIKNGACGI